VYQKRSLERKEAKVLKIISKLKRNAQKLTTHQPILEAIVPKQSSE